MFVKTPTAKSTSNTVWLLTLSCDEIHSNVLFESQRRVKFLPFYAETSITSSLKKPDTIIRNMYSNPSGPLFHWSQLTVLGKGVFRQRLPLI